MDQLMSTDTMSNDKYLSCCCINMCEGKYIFMTLQRQKYAEQSQLDMSVFRNWLLNKAQLPGFTHCPCAFGAILSPRDEGFPSASEGCCDRCHVSPKIPKAGLKDSEEKGNKRW